MIEDFKIRDMEALVRENIKGFMDVSHGDVREAIKAFGRSADFYSKGERRTLWVENHIRTHQDLLTEFRRTWGWSKKIDWSQLRMEDAYTFTIGSVIIALPRDSKGQIQFTIANG